MSIPYGRDQVLPRKFTLPRVCHLLSAWRELVARRIRHCVQAPACGKLPPRFVGNSLPAHFAYARASSRTTWTTVLRSAIDRTCRPLRMTPVRARDISPRVVLVTQVQALIGLLKDDRRAAAFRASPGGQSLASRWRRQTLRTGSFVAAYLSIQKSSTDP